MITKTEDNVGHLIVTIGVIALSYYYYYYYYYANRKVRRSDGMIGPTSGSFSKIHQYLTRHQWVNTHTHTETRALGQDGH
jgi:hypothetical protein